MYNIIYHHNLRLGEGLSEKDIDKIKKEFAKPRKTALEDAAEAVYEEKKAEEMDVYILIDRFGYVKSVDLATFERNKENILAENKFTFICNFISLSKWINA